MSNGRQHRKAARRYQVAEKLRAADKAVAVVVGTEGPDEVVMKGEVLYIVPRVLPGMPAELAQALGRRRQATLDGQCDCGGRRHAGRAARAGHIGLSTFLHEESCIAHDRALAEIVLRSGWRWSA